MSQDQQEAAAVAMWMEVMRQLGEDADRLVSENAKDECPDNQV